MSRHARAASAAKNALLLAHCAVTVTTLVLKPTTAVRQPRRRVTRRTQPQMMAFLPISSIPMIGKARRTTKLSVAIDPFTEVENLPLQLLAKASAALVAVQLLATLDFPALIGSYNGALATRPFTTKAAGTGITYFFSDLTAQALEGDRSSLLEKMKRAFQFALVGACVEINQCVGCTRKFFTKSFLGDGVAVLARSSGEEPASPRHRAGVASMA